MNYFPYILALSIFLAGISGCATITKSGELAQSFSELDQRLPQSDKLLQEAKARLAATSDAFTDNEQAIIRRGLQNIEQGERVMRQAYAQGGASEAVAFVRFIQSWGDVKSGYLLISGVIADKPLSPADARLYEAVAQEVAHIDSLVNRIKPSELSSQQYKMVARVIGLTAKVVGAMQDE